MDAFGISLLIYYIAIIAVFCLYGLHRYWQLWLFLRTGGLAGEDDAPPARFENPPRVTVQLPMFNERNVAERVIRAACEIDYPRERLQIQVLDDSTDDSAEVARRCCERMTAAGHDVEYRHRDHRSGYKAGALAEGLGTATGEFIALFDADFVPPRDILRRTIDQFTDDRLGMVQTRWAHLNRRQSLLTQIQALCLDGHFVIEQTARARTGRWFNFNGTAGIWRRRCIDDAGGWQHDTLTEDTDLSYRAQLAGWTFRYLPGVTCPAELPATVGALMSQQHRWNKGLVQTAFKLFPTILRSRAPWRAKIEAWFHLTSSVPYAAMFLLTLLVLPALVIGLPTTGISSSLALALGVTCLAFGTFAACAFSVVSQHAQGLPVGPAILRLPALMAIGVGVSALNTKAIVEAVMGWHSPFVRTPKSGGDGEGEGIPDAAPRSLVPRGAVELVMGGVMVACVPFTLTEPSALVGLPFVLLFASGYLAIGLPHLARLGGRRERERGAERLATGV